jgi:hypothetical protein
VVFTQRENFDILHNDQLVMVLVENGTIDQIPDILFVALGEVEHSLGITLRGFTETLTLWVFTNTLQNCSHGTGKLLNSGFVLLRGRLQSLPCSGAWFGND